VPALFKLVIARKAEMDGYTIKWRNTVYKDPSSFEQFRGAITESLWRPQAQARWWCALYQSVYGGNKVGSMPANVLRHSAVANNWTLKLIELEWK
jgi:hypothetical protein